MVTDIATLLFGLTRRSVLSLLLGRPDEQFYLRQIVRMTGTGLGPAQRELAALAQAGIITRTDASAVTYFLGRSEYDELEERGVCSDEVCAREGNLATYDTLRTTHLVTLITGAALGSVGAVVLLLDSRDAAPPPGSARLELRLGVGSSFIAGQF